MMANSVIDTVMAGRYGTLDLAAVGVGGARQVGAGRHGDIEAGGQGGHAKEKGRERQDAGDHGWNVPRHRQRPQKMKLGVASAAGRA
jgi:hypothetical protein